MAARSLRPGQASERSPKCRFFRPGDSTVEARMQRVQWMALWVLSVTQAAVALTQDEVPAIYHWQSAEKPLLY